MTERKNPPDTPHWEMLIRDQPDGEQTAHDGATCPVCACWQLPGESWTEYLDRLKAMVRRR